MTYKSLFSIFFLMLVSASMVHAQETPQVNYRANPQRTAVYEAEAIDESPIIAWQRTFAATDVDVFGVDDQLFVSATEQRNQTTLYALTTSGDDLWSVKMRGAIMGPVAYGHGLLLMGLSTGILTAVDTQNGETSWIFTESGRVWGAPLVVDNRVYIASARGWFALDAETGDQIWHNDACGESGTAVLTDGILFFPCRTSIEAVAAETGSSLWSVKLEGGPIYSLAVEGDGLIATGEQSLYAVSLQTQAVVWQSDASLNWSAPTVTAERVFAGNMDGFMYAYDRASGDLLWSLDVDDWATTEPSLIGSGLYL